MSDGGVMFVRAREALIAALTGLVADDDRLRALWLQGSLADGSADALSDVDAYVAVADEAFDAVFRDATGIVERLGRVWFATVSPQLRAVHAIVAADGDPAKLDLFFEPASRIGERQRPAVRVLLDKDGIASQLRGGWEPSLDEAIGRFELHYRGARQGALWPVRMLLRGDLAAYANAELRFINENIAALMAVQVDPRLLFMNALSMPRRLPAEKRAEIDALTAELVAALAAHDMAKLRDAHVHASDVFTREGRAAYALLGRPCPGSESGDAALRDFYLCHWPGA